MTALLAAAWLVLDYPWGLPAFVALAVRRQRFWDRRRPNLRESLAHSV
jgi:hypothetical protein